MLINMNNPNHLSNSSLLNPPLQFSIRSQWPSFEIFPLQDFFTPPPPLCLPSFTARGGTDGGWGSIISVEYIITSSPPNPEAMRE